MPEKEMRFGEDFFLPDSNTRRFHLGNAPQVGIPDDVTDEEADAIALHRAQIHAPDPRPRFRDEEGEAVAVPTAGLVMDDVSIGTVKPLEVDEKTGKVTPPTKAEQREAAKAAEAETEREMRHAGRPRSEQRAEPRG